MQPSIERGGGTPNILKDISFYYKDSYCIKMQAVERFHMTSLPSHWCPKTMKRQPCWCPKRVLFFPFVKAKAFFSFQYISLICTAADHLSLCSPSLSQNAYLVLWLFCCHWCTGRSHNDGCEKFEQAFRISYVDTRSWCKSQRGELRKYRSGSTPVSPRPGIALRLKEWTARAW